MFTSDSFWVNYFLLIDILLGGMDLFGQLKILGFFLGQSLKKLRAPTKANNTRTMSIALAAPVGLEPRVMQ